MSFDYLLTAFIVCLAPGIGVVYTLSATLGGGFRAGFWASVGCTIATIIHMVVAMAGLADFDLMTGSFDLRPFNLYALTGTAGGVISSALASVALWRGWGRK